MKEVVLPSSMEPEERQRLQDSVLHEARAAARLHHPSAVAVYDVVKDGDRPFIVMELVEAPNLKEVVADKGPLNPDQAAGIGLDLIEVLEAAHASGLVHRDVKPANVLVPSVGKTRLSDFGIASVIDDPSITATGILKGTPSYMAPEQALGTGATPASDMWSLGATLYFAVEGEAPFDQGQALATLTAIAMNEPRPAQRAGPMGEVLGHLLAKDPTARPGYRQLRAELQAIAHVGEGFGPRPEATPQLVARPQAPSGDFADSRPQGGEPIAGDWGQTDTEPMADGGPVTETGPVTDVELQAQVRMAALGGALWADQALPLSTPPTAAEARATAAFAWHAGPAPSASPAAPSGLPGDSAIPASSGLPAGTAIPASTSRALPPGIGADSSRAPDHPEARSRRRRRWPVVVLVGVLVVAVAAYGVARLVGSRHPAQLATPDGAAGGVSPAAAATIPAGWAAYTDSATGFKVAYPPGWNIVRRGTLTDFRDPRTGTYLRIDHQSPPESTPDGPWYALEKSFAAANPGYRRISITRTVFHGYPAATWEYTYGSSGNQLHAIDLGLIAGNFGFGFNFQTTDATWSNQQSLLHSLEAAFQP